MVQVSGQKIVEVVEVPVAIAETDARAYLFRNVPGQFKLISLPILVERRLDHRGCHGRGGERRTQKIAWWRCAAIVVLAEISILGNAVGPKIELVDQTEMLSKMHRGFEINHVGDPVGSACSGAGEGEGVGARDQAAEGFVQGSARYRGAVRKRSENLHPREVAAAQT